MHRHTHTHLEWSGKNGREKTESHTCVYKCTHLFPLGYLYFCISYSHRSNCDRPNTPSLLVHGQWTHINDYFCWVQFKWPFRFIWHGAKEILDIFIYTLLTWKCAYLNWNIWIITLLGRKHDKIYDALSLSLEIQFMYTSWNAKERWIKIYIKN